MSEINHYVQCERCGYRRTRKRARSTWVSGKPVYFHDNVPVYLDICGKCQKAEADRWRDQAKDKL